MFGSLLGKQKSTGEVDPKRNHVETLLSDLASPDSSHFSQEDWNNMGSLRPNLKQFIETAAAELAPGDLSLRERITRVLMGEAELLGWMEVTTEQVAITEQLEADMTQVVSTSLLDVSNK